MEKTGDYITGDQGMLGKFISRELWKSNKFTVLNEAVSMGLSSDVVKEYESDLHFINGTRVKRNEVDITDSKMVDQLERSLTAPNRDRALWIIHLAAWCGTDKCEADSFGAVNSNVIGTQNIIKMVKNINAKLIYFSTTAINNPDEYMKPGCSPFNENAKIGPKTIYGLTKYAGELACRQSLNNSQLMVIKPVFIYGDAPHDNSSILRKILQAIRTKQPLNVLLDRDYKKDYIRIEQFANMFATLLHAPIKDIFTDQRNDFVLCKGEPKPFGYYLDLIQDLTQHWRKNDCMYNYIGLHPEKDYLKDHVGHSKRFNELFPFYNHPYYDDVKSLMQVWRSLEEYYD